MKLVRLFPSLLLATAAAAWSPQAPPLQVVSITPAAGSDYPFHPGSVTVTFNAPIDPATATASTVRLFRAGADGVLGTSDDVAVVPAGVSVVGGNQIVMDFSGVALPNDKYRVVLSGTVAPDPAPIGRWALDESSGTAAIDASGNGHDGTLVNAPTRIAGKTGNALHLDGTTQEVLIPDSDQLSPHVGPSGEMSLSAWVRIATLPNIAGPRYGVVCKGQDNDWEYVIYIYGDSTVSFAACVPNSGAYAEARGGSITTGVWHHLAGTMKKGTSVKVWLDGVPVDNRLNFGGDTFNLNAPLRIGRSGPNPLPFEYLSGDVDDVRLFNKELTAAQVMSLASLGNAVRDTAGNVLAGGDYVSDFLLRVAPPRVDSMTPAPGSSLASSPSTITLTFNHNLDAATVGRSSVTLVRAGPDLTLGTPDDVVVTPTSFTVAPQNKITIALPALPNDLYQLTLSSVASLPTSGLVNVWSMDEGIGPTAGDPAGGANGTIIGPLWRPGRVGNALHFNGISDTINAGAAPLPVPWTATMWVRREDAPSADARLMDPGIFAGGTLRLESFNDTNRVGVAIYGVGDYPSAYTAPLGTWVHLAFVGTPSNTQIYVDGVQQDVLPASFSVPRFFIGSHGYNTMLGTIDDVRIYNRNLSDPELRSLASLGGAVRDQNGNALDGEFVGTLPSGDGLPGADFVATFSVNYPLAPGAFTLDAPDDGLTEVSIHPTFTWNSAPGAVTYTLQVARDASFTTMVINQPSLSSTFYNWGITLSPTTTYYWRVLAVNGVGTSIATGSPRSFSTTTVSSIVVGGCGMSGLDAALVIALLLARRRLRSRG
jgi:hypothetical protein